MASSRIKTRTEQILISFTSLSSSLSSFTSPPLSRLPPHIASPPVTLKSGHRLHRISSGRFCSSLYWSSTGLSSFLSLSLSKSQNGNLVSKPKLVLLCCYFRVYDSWFPNIVIKVLHLLALYMVLSLAILIPIHGIHSWYSCLYSKSCVQSLILLWWSIVVVLLYVNIQNLHF